MNFFAVIAITNQQLFEFLQLREYYMLASVSNSFHHQYHQFKKRTIRRRGLFVSTANWDQPSFAAQPKVRLLFWEHELRCCDCDVDYDSCVFQYDPHIQNDGELGEIQRDLPRTFPQHPLFLDELGEGQQGLGRVLRALRQAFPAVGYSQGMNFVAGVFLILVSSASSLEIFSKRSHSKSNLRANHDWVATKTEYVQKERATKQTRSTSASEHPVVDTAHQKEARVFRMMWALIKHKGMDRLWEPNMPGLKIKIHQLNDILRSKLPRLQRHMEEEGLLPDFFASKWFLTLHTYTLPLQLVCIVWDGFVMDGFKAVFRGGLALLLQREQQLLQLDMGDIATMFNKKVGLPKSPARSRKVKQGHSSTTTNNNNNNNNNKVASATLEFQGCYERIKVTKSMLLRSERGYKKERLFEMMKWRGGNESRDEKSSSSTTSSSFSMHVYDDPAASSSLGPSAVARVKSQYFTVEEKMKVDTKNLRDRLETVKTTLRHTLRHLNSLTHQSRSLLADLQNAEERKILLMSQFDFFSQEKDHAIIVPMLRTKIESTTKDQATSDRLFRQVTSECLLLEVNKDQLVSERDNLHNLLLECVADGDERLGQEVERLFEEFQLV